MSYSRIVVTSDLSELSEKAFSQAILMAKQSTCPELVLLVVFQDPTMSSTPGLPGSAVMAASGMMSKSYKETVEKTEKTAY